MKKHATPALCLVLLTILTACAHQATQPLRTYNIENKAVRQYLSYGRYETFGSTSYFDTHSDTLTTELCFGMDTPQPVTISWKGEPSRYLVTLTDDTKHAVVFSQRECSDTTYDFVNLIPGHNYSYTVSNASEQVAADRFRTLGQVRMVTIADTWNYRDLGGWKGLAGHPIRYEWIYRGGSLNGVWHGGRPTTSNTGDPERYVLSEEARQQILDLGIKAELDLRGVSNEGAWGNQDGLHSRAMTDAEGKAVGHLLFDDSFAFTHIMTDLGLYDPLKRYSVVQDVAYIIDQVVNHHRPIAFHCKSGADRTGAVGMLLNALLGVHPGDIARDYELTTLSHEKKILEGASALQVRKASDGVHGSYGFFGRGFTTLSESMGSDPSDSSDYQSKAYYYLNQYFSAEGIAINASDLDRFIQFMLNLSDKEYAPYKHAWAKEYGSSRTLQDIYNKVQK